MHIVRAGAGAPPLVFVHGFACSSADWAPQLDHFAPRHRVLACDLRGHGGTPATRGDVSIETFGGDVARLLAEEDLAGAVLVGHSMGCRVVLQAARVDPARIGGLVLIDGSRMAAGDVRLATQNAAAAIAAQGYLPWARGFVESMFVATSDPALKAATVARALQLPEAIGAVLFARMNAWDAAQMDGALRAVRVPLLVIQSTRLTPERVRASLAPGESSPYLELVRALVPAARVAIVPGVGHFAQLEAPAAVNQLIEAFIAR